MDKQSVPATHDWIMLTVYDPNNTRHKAFVVGSWCDHLRNSYSGYAKKSRNEFSLVRANIERICQKAKPLIAHSIEGEPYYGFVCAEYGKDSEQILHFLYVRELYRRNGIANILMRVSFNQLGKNRIIQTFPMKRAKYFSEKWLLEEQPRKKYE